MYVFFGPRWPTTHDVVFAGLMWTSQREQRLNRPLGADIQIILVILGANKKDRDHEMGPIWGGIKQAAKLISILGDLPKLPTVNSFFFQVTSVTTHQVLDASNPYPSLVLKNASRRLILFRSIFTTLQPATLL